MRATEQTHRNIKRLHLWMAGASLALLAVTVWVLMDDHLREWKNYQRTFKDQIQPWMTEARPGPAERLLRLPIIDAFGRPLVIEQIWLPELTIDYNFRQVARFDRCTTCHQGIDKSALSSPSLSKSLPQPYCSHPRLDLFVGLLSPHPMEKFGCTICHDGQGSATEFKWASHTPNDPAERTKWRERHCWFRNRHWDFPMMPERFAESRCLKCHHAVTDLEPSDRFPDPPAKKLLAGYNLVRQRGCFGCHEIDGFDDSGKSVGPDMRLEPNYTAAALELLARGELNDQQRAMAHKVVDSPDDARPRKELADSIFAGATGKPSDLIALAKLLSVEPPHPGTMRKVGPSLRDVAGRLDIKFLTDWIGNPFGFRPATKMPRFFGLHQHLDDRSMEDARRFEAVEIRAVAEYLLSGTAVPAVAETTKQPSVERGKKLFEIHGCLACHTHGDFLKGLSTQGPNLSNLGSKYTTKAGREWLAGWIRDPVHYSPRTLMPNVLLEPTPTADIAAYLSASTKDQPPAGPADVVEADLDELALMHLSKLFPTKQAETYLKDEIPKSLSERLQGDARILLGEMTVEKKLRYVGCRTIRKRGCYGCHDIPGFEDAKPIAPALTDWGRKQESLLAFEQVGRFVEEVCKDSKAPRLRRGATKPQAAKPQAADSRHGFFMEALQGQRREGFLWQKLRGPRSFDYKKAQNRSYNEWLTMGRFGFTDEQIEAVSTFVLGLVADPSPRKFVYHPDVRRHAIVEGRKVLDKYACAECHTLDMERWTFEFDPNEFEAPPQMEGYDFLRPYISPERLAASMRTDQRGLARVEVVGMPLLDADGELMIVDDDEDEHGNELLQYGFTLWQPAAIAGRVWTVGGADVLIWDRQITGKRPPLGGTFARLLYPVALAEGRAAGSSAAGPEAWGWVPPPLVHEGKKVRPEWLHDYLLEPTRIRPAVVLTAL